MSFQELDEFFDDTLELPIRGKIYKIPSPDGETGLWCQRVFEVGARVESGQKVPASQSAKLQLNDNDERELYDRVLGPAKQEMLDDGLTWARISAAAQTAIIWIATDRTTAEKYWNEQVVGGGPKAQPRQPQDHKPPAKKATAKRTGTTRSSRQGSPAGSKPRKNNTASTGSAGSTSSATGS